MVSLCVSHIYIISLPEPCKEQLDPAAPHGSLVLFLRWAFQTKSSRSAFAFCNLGQQIVRGETEGKFLGMYLQAFFDHILVFQLDSELAAVAILRFKENNAAKNNRKGKWLVLLQSANSQETMQLMFGPQNIDFKPWGRKYFQAVYVKLKFYSERPKSRNVKCHRTKEMQEMLSIAVYSPPAKASDEQEKFICNSKSTLYFAGLQSFVPHIPFCLSENQNSSPDSVLKKCHPDSGGIFVSLLSSACPSLHPCVNSEVSKGNKPTPPVVKTRKHYEHGNENRQAFKPEILQDIRRDCKTWSTQ